MWHACFLLHHLSLTILFDASPSPSMRLIVILCDLKWCILFRSMFLKRSNVMVDIFVVSFFSNRAIILFKFRFLSTNESLYSRIFRGGSPISFFCRSGHGRCPSARSTCCLCVRCPLEAEREESLLLWLYGSFVLWVVVYYRRVVCRAWFCLSPHTAVAILSCYCYRHIVSFCLELEF